MLFKQSHINLTLTFFILFKSDINNNPNQMKKVSHSEHSSHISLQDTINPQDSDNKCKICFEQKKPLITLCQCIGSIAYVHQDCILDWIALKIEKTNVIKIPKCEICKADFSAAIKIGSKSIDNKLLIQKMRNSTKKDWLLFSASLFAFFIAFITILTTVFFIISGETFRFDNFSTFTISVTKVGFLQLLFPAMFINQRLKYFKGKWKIIDACKVQLVEVTILPKTTLKS